MSCSIFHQKFAVNKLPITQIELFNAQIIYCYLRMTTELNKRFRKTQDLEILRHLASNECEVLETISLTMKIVQEVLIMFKL